MEDTPEITESPEYTKRKSSHHTKPAKITPESKVMRGSKSKGKQLRENRSYIHMNTAKSGIGMK